MKRNYIEMVEKCGYTCEAGALENNTDWKAIKENINNTVGVAPIGSFSWALIRLKEGAKVQRKGWNGKKQYIELASNISYINANGELINRNHDAMGNKAIAFVGTSGVQIGWLASQADMLAEDWEVVE